MDILLWAQVIVLLIGILMQFIRFVVDLYYELRDRQRR